MSLGKIFAICSFSLKQVWDRIQAQSVYAHTQPKIKHVDHCFANFWIVKVKIGLVSVKSMPEIGTGNRIPTPIRRLEVLKDNPRFPVLVWRVAPHIPIAPMSAWRRM